MILKNKKGQVALEFLMIYGWAIIGVMVIIGGLFYFDVLDISNKLPEQANFPPPFQTIHQAVSNGNGIIVIPVKSNLDAEIEILLTDYSGTDECEDITSFESNPTIIPPYGEFIIKYTCPNIVEQRISTYLSFSYKNTESNNVYKTTGYVSVNG